MSTVETPLAPPAAKPPLAPPAPIAKAAAPPLAKPPIAAATPKPPAPPMPAGRSPLPSGRIEAPRAPETISRTETPKSIETPALRPSAAERAAAPIVEPHLTMADVEPESFFEKIPMAVKIGVALLLLFVGVYFAIGRSPQKSAGDGAVSVGEQGWSTEWASDVAGSRRARQLTLYRPSVGMADYQFKFVGQIENKALGWVFHEVDTKNYYAMKIENLGSGKMAITHFAVVDGRESGYSQRPLGADSRPGAAYRVMLEVNGPRFTAYLSGEPVDFWTDNRLKAGAVGFMNERDERGATSAVEFSFPKGVK